VVRGQQPRSLAFRALLGEEGEAAFRAVIKGADCVAVGRGGAFDAAAAGFLTAQRCMRLVDADRLLAACEAWRCGGWLGSLAPLSCSPKNSVLVLLPEGDGLAAGLQGIRGQRRGGSPGLDDGECGVCDDDEAAGRAAISPATVPATTAAPPPPVSVSTDLHRVT